MSPENANVRSDRTGCLLMQRPAVSYYISLINQTNKLLQSNLKFQHS